MTNKITAEQLREIHASGAGGIILRDLIPDLIEMAEELERRQVIIDEANIALEAGRKHIRVLKKMAEPLVTLRTRVSKLKEVVELVAEPGCSDLKNGHVSCGECVPCKASSLLNPCLDLPV
jgi:hypothetical protein